MLQKTYNYRLLLAMLALLLLNGCGFQLRDQANLPQSVLPIYIQGPDRYDIFRVEMTRTLRANGIEVVEEQGEAAAVLRIRNHRLDSRVLSVKSDTGKAAEYELHNYMHFDLVDPVGNELVAPQKVSITRTYLTQRYGILDDWRKDMRRDLINQMLRRLHTHLQ
jgi:LPS-assembly lipoprotein